MTDTRSRDEVERQQRIFIDDMKATGCAWPEQRIRQFWREVDGMIGPSASGPK